MIDQSPQPEEIAEARIAEATRTKGPALDLVRLGLKTLPESIGKLTWLQRLDVYGNQLTTLPDSVGKLVSLQTLSLFENQLTMLPDSIGKLASLKRLDAYGNRLTTLPESIGELTALQRLDLDRNRLTALPESIGNLTALEMLSLSGNRLMMLPESIGNLTALRTLYLRGNRLTILPESVGRLKALWKLELDTNPLTMLPDSLGKLPNLTELTLHENPALEIPVELLDSFRKHTDILDYYFRSRLGRPLNEAKLIFVGRGGVGKTSLVSRLVDNTFNPSEKKTEGIQITHWNITLNSHELVRLNVWDFGGQEIMHATHQFFLTWRSLYVLVLNGREGEEERDADYWLRLIESFGGNSPVIIVLNKIHEHAFDVNRRALQQKYVGIREFVATDCEDATGIADLSRAIKRETDRLEGLRVKFPASWVSIKDRLAAMKENFLDFDSYRKLCSELGEGDREAQEKLASYLHSLGIALNFSDDPRLQDTHVLNPHWVTKGIYKILNARQVAEQKGEIATKDLKSVLDNAAYPIRMHGFLLDLMRKFELCFPLGDGSTGRVLIPELLDKQEPAETAEFVPEGCLNFEYHYPVLPEGIIPRFIVRTHAMSTGLPRWRSGVILKFDGNKALVRGDVQAHKLSVSVSGPVAGRRNLLAIIRSDLERIHSDIPKLEAKAMVPVPEYPKEVIEYDDLLQFEAEGVKEYPKRLGGKIVKLDVHTLLNGVDVVERRKIEPAVRIVPKGVTLFISYSHKDETFRAELDAHLKLFQRIGLIEKWDDRLVNPAEEWKAEIDKNLERADIILFLVSADFLNSDFCWKEEMSRALERHESGKARVIPVIIRDTAWQKAKFAKLQVLPKDAKPITQWSDRDAAWRNVAEAIEKVAQEVQNRKN
jgi:internalin A